MKNVTLKQFRYFEALARLGHFGLAADACAISQPALSMQIKELEAAVGSPLFERAPRQVRLTAFGTEFEVHVREILRKVDELGEVARAAARDGLAGPLRLGVIPTIAPYLLPRLIATLAREVPEVEPYVRETLTPALLRDVGDGRLDIAVVALPVSEPAFEEAPLFAEDFVLVRPRAEAALPVPSASRLREMRLLLLEEGHCFRDQALAFCGGGAARETLDASSLSTLVQMVAAGLGVTLVPEMAVPVETRSAAVAIARFPDPAPARQVGLIWRRASPLAPRFRDLSAILREAIRAR